MKTDTLFYQIFQAFPQLVFLLLDRDVIPGYTFTSVEVKEKSFRFDGIFMPPIDSMEPIYFVEVQFQHSPNFYWSLLSEIFLYLNQQKPIQDWVAVAIFPDRDVDVRNLSMAQQEIVNSGRIVRIYLDELPDRSFVEFEMLKLITCPQHKAVEVVSQIRSSSQTKAILEFIETILVYKFPKLSREAIEKMFTLDDLRQTRVFQEIRDEYLQEGMVQGIQLGKQEGIQLGKQEGIQLGKQEGIQLGKQEGIQLGKQEGIQLGKQEGIQLGKQEGIQLGKIALLVRLIKRKFGEPDREIATKISTLTLEQLENLGEELLDFTTADDLTNWLASLP